MTTVQASIGRRVGTHAELSDQSWGDFKSRTVSTLAQFGPVVFAGQGEGFDPVSEGSEVSFTVVADYSHLSGERLDTALRGIRGDLADLARAFGQQSIALTVGATEFVAATSLVESEVGA